MVDVMRPEIGMTICDPACGTGGFLLAVFESAEERTVARQPAQPVEKGLG